MEPTFFEQYKWPTLKDLRNFKSKPNQTNFIE